MLEVLTEGGITRFLAPYHRQLPDDVGPIRSARLSDLDLAPAFDPILAISGARPEVLSELTERVEVVTETGPPLFWRREDRPAPHDLYVRPRELLDARDLPGPPRSFQSAKGVTMDETVGRFGSRAEAEMVRQLLDDAGISARLRADDAGSMHPELGRSGNVTASLVAPEHRDGARGFLDEVADAPEDREEPDRSRPSHTVRRRRRGPAPGHGGIRLRGPSGCAAHTTSVESG